MALHDEATFISWNTRGSNRQRVTFNSVICNQSEDVRVETAKKVICFGKVQLYWNDKEGNQA